VAELIWAYDVAAGAEAAGRVGRGWRRGRVGARPACGGSRGVAGEIGAAAVVRRIVTAAV